MQSEMLQFRSVFRIFKSTLILKLYGMCRTISNLAQKSEQQLLLRSNTMTAKTTKNEARVAVYQVNSTLILGTHIEDTVEGIIINNASVTSEAFAGYVVAGKRDELVKLKIGANTDVAEYSFNSRQRLDYQAVLAEAAVAEDMKDVHLFESAFSSVRGKK